MEIKNKTFLVYGSGVSGISAYNFLKNKGANVYIYTDKKSDRTDDLNYINKFSDVSMMNFDYVVVSPGIQIIGNRNINKLKKMGIMLISELELGYLFCKGMFIAVTGTNGKTTCVNLLNHILKTKYKTILCGNVGVPITSVCDLTDDESVVICEVSSFMLELTSLNFAPDIALITNVTPDHISRHKNYENYLKIKLKITENQQKNQFLLVSDEFKDVKTEAQKIIVDGLKKYKSNLIGEFNLKNINFCAKVCNILGISDKEFKRTVKSFLPVKYRLQILGKKRGITYINDSKSTNTDSTVQAIKSMKRKVVVFLGGSDKGNDFYEIFKLKDKIKLAVIYGETANKLEEDALFMGFNNICKFENLNEALYYFKSYTQKGDTILFSPACASYDEFNNYVERGEYFNNFYLEQ